MRLSKTEQGLMKAFEEFEVIDAHEHLPPEHVRTGQRVDVFTLFSHYTSCDLITAGMKPGDRDALYDANRPLDYRWGLLRPFLEHIRYGSYARPAFIAAKEFYGFDDINDDTYRPLSEEMQRQNTPGIYRRILRDKCRIRHALTQAQRTDYDDDLLLPLMPIFYYSDVFTWQEILSRAHELGERVATLDDYILVAERGVVKWKSEGAVGIKMISWPYGEPDRAQALSAFEDLRRGAQQKLEGFHPLRAYVVEQMLHMAVEHDLVVAVHAGVWEDFRKMSSSHMIPIVMRNPKTRFDLYHMGVPEVRATGNIGKNFPNVWLNLCWTHIVSPVMTRSGLDEYMDMVPVNKLIAFGGDYNKPVEKVYGHLVMTRENIAMVLGRRVDAGLMTEGQAIAVARKWFFDNPMELYGLEARGKKREGAGRSS
jgi:predicted TIM-barrel fold metal-dependent hydrolase